VTLLLVLLIAAPLAANIPLAALAAILLFVAWNMGEWREFARLRHFAVTYRIILLVTFFLTVVFDLTVAVEVGLVLSSLFFIYRISQLTRVEHRAGDARIAAQATRQASRRADRGRRARPAAEPAQPLRFCRTHWRREPGGRPGRCPAASARRAGGADRRPRHRQRTCGHRHDRALLAALRPAGRRAAATIRAIAATVLATCIPPPTRCRLRRASPLPAMTYESEITQFIKQLKAQNPELERKQREGRAIWWDKNLDRDELKRQQQARVPQPGYVYQTQAKK
jgi:hypothetical protein